MTFQTVPVVLQAKRAMRLVIPKGSRLQATHGTLWLTVTGDRNDYVFHPGSEFRLTRKAEVVLEALFGPAGFQLRADAAPQPSGGLTPALP
jgi:hypothetical protein